MNQVKPKSKKITGQETKILSQVLLALREPLPQNGSPHVIVVIYNRDSWFVNKAAPKGACRND